MSLMSKLLKSGSTTGASVLSESEFFNSSENIQTSVPIINIAFSGKIDGGFQPGLTILAGESKTFKSALSLYCMKAYLDAYDDAVGILYDSEFGVTPEYIRSFGIDPSRVIHIPVEHVEQLKFDFVKKLESIEKGEHVFFMVDSIGQISSKKEVEDANDEKSVADMTRAKAIRSLLRLITVQLAKKSLPCFMINHVYMEMGAMYPKTVIPGGTAVTYSANTILVVTKSQEKSSDGELLGWSFKLNVHKSRYVREKSQLPFTVYYEEGIKRFSGLMDIALDLKAIVKPSNGWYSKVNLTTGEIEDKKYRLKDTDNNEFWNDILKSEVFKERIKNTYMLTGSMEIKDEEIDQEMEEA
jgi:RecA/RadA recombinase